MNLVAIDNRTVSTSANVYDVYDDKHWTDILLHDTESASEAGALDWLQGGSWRYDHTKPASSHFLVRAAPVDGKGVVQIGRYTWRTYHAGASIWRGRQWCNDYCIGIEIHRPPVAPGKYQYTEFQKDAVARLCVQLADQFGMGTPSLPFHREVRAQWLAVHPGSAPVKYDPIDWDREDTFRRMRVIRDGLNTSTTSPAA